MPRTWADHKREGLSESAGVFKATPIITSEFITLLKLHVAESRTVVLLILTPFQMATFNILWKRISVPGRRLHSHMERWAPIQIGVAEVKVVGIRANIMRLCVYLRCLLRPLTINVNMYTIEEIFRQNFPKRGLSSKYVDFFLKWEESVPYFLKKQHYREYSTYKQRMQLILKSQIIQYCWIFEI